MKKLTALLLVLAMALTLVACSGKGVTLNVVTSYGGDDGNRGNYEAAVTEYEKKTGNQINDASATSSEEWKAKVVTDFETGSEPDVLFFFTNADAEPFVSAGKVVSVAEIRKEYPDYASNMKDSMFPVAADGKSYAIPSYGYWEQMFVNKKVLEDANVALPGTDYTWDQFLADCQKIKDAGYTPIGCSLFEVPHYWFEFAVMNNGSVANHMEVPELDGDGNLVMNDVAKKWIAGLEDIKTLYDLGYFPENTLTSADAETVKLVADGDAAFLIDGSWKCGYFADNCPDNLDDFTVVCVPGKGERKATDIISGISSGYFITRKAWDDPAKREAAVKLVEHLTSNDVMANFVTSEVTALIDSPVSESLTSLQKEALALNANVTGTAGAVQDTIGNVKAVLFANIPAVVTGEMTPAEAITAALKAA